MTEKILDFAKEKTTFLMGIQSTEQLDEWLSSHPAAIGIAVTGRSNVGKSSLINTLFGKQVARTSKTPGRTQQINIFSICLNDESIEQTYFLYDLPGYGHAEVSKKMATQWNKLMGVFFEKLPTRTLLLNIQDARHPYQRSDQEYLRFIEKLGFSTFIVLNKIDKLKTQKERSVLKKKMPELYPKLKIAEQIYLLSALKRSGVDPLREALISFLLQQE